MHSMNLLRALATLAVAAAPALADGAIQGRVDATPGKYLEETVVFLTEVPGTYPAKLLSMDQTRMKFTPHILLATAGDTVRFLNNDGVDHNVYSPDGETYNLKMISQGKSADHKFTSLGVYSQLCSVHPEMIAYIYVGQNPYSAVVARDGTFKIEKVPAGSWNIGVWNAHLKAPQQAITVADGKTAEVSFSVKR